MTVDDNASIGSEVPSGPESRHSRPHYDLGVLFVHGIGNQKRGQHLVQMGEALIGWLDRWIRVEEAGPVSSLTGERLARPLLKRKSIEPPIETIATGVEVRDAHLSDGSSGDPAYAEMTVSLPEETGGVVTSRWLLAESHWAEEFLPPSFIGLCRWGLYAVPWTLAFHFGGSIRRSWRRAAERAGPGRFVLKLLDLAHGLCLLVTLPILTSIAMALIVVLLILALVPIPWLRRWLGEIQRTLAGTVGDSLVLLESPIQAAAIVGRAARDIRWVADRTNRIAVVAHSQGAVVALEALATGVLAGRSRRDHLLFTFGSGLAKLEALRALRRDKPRWAGWVPPGALFLGLVALVEGGWVGRGMIEEPSRLLGFCIGVVAVYIFWSGVRSAMSASRLDISDAQRLMPSRRFGIALRWCDRWATADPVPSGPLFDSDACPSYLEMTEDVNLGSVWRDHAAYHRNFDGFLPGLVRELASLAGLDLVLRAGDDARLRLGRYRRAFRVRTQASLRLFTLVAMVAVPLALRATVLPARMGDWLLDRLRAFADSLPVFVATLLQYVERLGGQGLGLASLGLAVLAAYGVVALLWLRLEWVDKQAFFWRWRYDLGYRWHRWSLAAGSFMAVVVSAILAPVRVPPGEQAWSTFLFTGYIGFVFLCWCVGLGSKRFFDRLRGSRKHPEKGLFRPVDDVGVLSRIAEGTVWTYALTVSIPLVVWRILAEVTEASDRILTASLSALALVSYFGMTWIVRYMRTRVECLAALGEPEAALAALEQRAPRIRGADPALDAALRRRGPG